MFLQCARSGGASRSFRQRKGPALRPIRTVVDVVLLAEDISEAKAQKMLGDEWRFRSLPSNTHQVNDVEDVLFLIWASRESIWHVVKEAGDEGEIDLPSWHSRHRGGSEDEQFAGVTKVERNVNESILEKMMMGKVFSGPHHLRAGNGERPAASYVQGTENVQQHVIPLNEVGDRGLGMARRQTQQETTRRVKAKSAPPAVDPRAKATWRRQAEEELAMALLAGLRGDLAGPGDEANNQDAEAEPSSSSRGGSNNSEPHGLGDPGSSGGDARGPAGDLRGPGGDSRGSRDVSERHGGSTREVDTSDRSLTQDGCWRRQGDWWHGQGNSYNHGQAEAGRTGQSLKMRTLLKKERSGALREVQALA